MLNDDSCISAKYDLWRFIVPCRFFLQNQNRIIFHETISILVRLFQVVLKLEYNSYTKMIMPEIDSRKSAFISLGKPLLISRNHLNLGENLT